MEKEIIINNKLNETGRISQFMEELGVSLNIPSEIAMSMNLAIEEIIANIIRLSERRIKRNSASGTYHSRKADFPDHGRRNRS